MKLLIKFLLIATAFAILDKAETKTFTQLSNCKAKLKNGAIVDLNPLDNPKLPM